jgi:hypothetical protein
MFSSVLLPLPLPPMMPMSLPLFSARCSSCRPTRPLGNRVLDGIRLEYDALAAFAFHEAAQDVAVVDGCPFGGRTLAAVAQHIVPIAPMRWPFSSTSSLRRVAHHIQVHAGNVQYTHLTFQAVGMQMWREWAMDLLMAASMYKQVRRVLARSCSASTKAGNGEILMTDVEGLGHGAHELLLLITHLAAGSG